MIKIIEQEDIKDFILMSPFLISSLKCGPIWKQEKDEYIHSNNTVPLQP